MTLRENLLSAAAEQFNQYGAKFTLQDVSKSIGISKKTIYTVFPDKESLLYAMLDETFKAIKQAEKEILDHPNYTTVEKIKKVIIALPEVYQQIDYSKFHTIKERYPKLFEAVANRIESDWEPTLALIQQGIDEGVIKPINLNIFKGMVEASIEHFLLASKEDLGGATYCEALEAMIDLLIDGAAVRK